MNLRLLSGVIRSARGYRNDLDVLAAVPELWFDPRFIQAASGSTVQTWTDRMIAARTATQANAARRPTYILGESNGPVLRFDGTVPGDEDGLQVAAIDLSTFPSVTMMAVADNRSAVLAGAVVVESSASFSVNAGGMILAYSITIVDDVDYGHRGNAAGAAFKISVAAQSGMRVLAIVSDFTQTGAAEIAAYSNGVVPATADTNQDNTDAGHGNHALNIGARNNAASVWLTGDIAHVLRFVRALTPGQVAIVSRALMLATGIAS